METKEGSWWSKDTIAVVTGGNRGIGYEIVRALAREGLTVVLTSRDPSRGRNAVDALKAEGLESVVFHQLEVTDSESVEKLAHWLRKEYRGIDILINNAGIGLAGAHLDYELATSVINTNYYGPKYVTEALLPLLRPSPPGARIINVSSGAGFPERLGGESLKQKFKDEKIDSVDVVDSLATKFLEDVKAGQQYREGWIPEDKVPAYSESKLFLNAYTFALAKSLFKSQPDEHRIFVTSFCPGPTKTDMFDRAIAAGGFTGPTANVKSAKEVADIGVRLALLPKGEILERNGKVIS